MRGLPNIVSVFFRKVFNELTDTGTRMQDSIYQIKLTFKKLYFWRKNLKM